MKEQYINDDTLQNEAFQIRDDFTLLEQSKLAHNIIDLIINDIQYNLETNDDKKSFNTLITTELQLNEIIKRNEVK
jgi:hypothetical protein|nr:MAG TPA: hypothetical protein [Caudoviricetes sp.]